MKKLRLSDLPKFSYDVGLREVCLSSWSMLSCDTRSSPFAQPVPLAQTEADLCWLVRADGLIFRNLVSQLLNIAIIKSQITLTYSKINYIKHKRKNTQSLPLFFMLLKLIMPILSVWGKY